MNHDQMMKDILLSTKTIASVGLSSNIEKESYWIVSYLKEQGYLEDAIKAGAKVVWMQEGIVNEEAAQKAREAGLQVVMDACMRATHRRLIGAKPISI